MICKLRKICFKHIDNTVIPWKTPLWPYEQRVWILVGIKDEKNGEKLCDRNALSFSTLQI